MTAPRRRSRPLLMRRKGEASRLTGWRLVRAIVVIVAAVALGIAVVVLAFLGVANSS